MNRKGTAFSANSKGERISESEHQSEAVRLLSRLNVSARVPKEGTGELDDIFGEQNSEHAQILRAEIKRVARCPFNILITGETGTGKTHAAREIHRQSARANNPFMELNCANLPEQLVEAELFGYTKGAFTGADRDHSGLFEEANGGILFLDEVGDLLPSVQNKLLRAIEEKQIKRLGSNRYLNCDVQIIAATSRNLPEMIQRGEFREDLYCRLAVLSVETAPLRERREDIPAMIALYLREAANAVAKQANQFESYQIDEGALALLCRCEYPGNIRALRNLVYELTSYVSGNEPISVELVQIVLAKLNSRGGNSVTTTVDSQSANPYVSLISERNPTNTKAAAHVARLQSIVSDGDIILPLELCVLRRGETFKQWTARAKRCSIQAARRATGGSLQSAAQRLGLTRSSLQAHLHRAKLAQKETLFDWERDPKGDS